MVSFYQTKGRRTAHSQRKRFRSTPERPSGTKVKRTLHATKRSTSTRAVKNAGRASRTRKGSHHAVRYCKLRSRRFLVLHPGKHKAMEIMNRAIRSFDRPERLWSKEQHRALREWRRWVKDWAGPSAGTKPMRRAIGILGKIFFLGRLRRCTFAWNQELYGGRIVGFTVPGLTSAHIEMNPEDLHEMDGTADAVTSYIGTLLHECVHAFIEVYTCGDRCRRLSCIEAHDFHVGKTGHALAWTLLAARVQRTARIVLGLEVKLGVCDGISREYESQQFMIQHYHWCQLNGIDATELKMMLGSLRFAQEAKGWDAASGRAFAGKQSQRVQEVIDLARGSHTQAARPLNSHAAAKQNASRSPVTGAD